MTRTTKAGRRKSMGVHYTPAALAAFIAERVVANLPRDVGPELRILDPACGDGILLEAILQALQAGRPAVECHIVGVEADSHALERAQARCADLISGTGRFVEADFLDLVTGQREEPTLWGPDSAESTFAESFDIVVANPPYVRTQVLGSDRSRQLAARYGLSGRVDLYHVFLIAATRTLKPGAWMGIITSNRFLTTLGGKAVRGFLMGQFDIRELIDLGDTKLFEAAVLPAILVCQRQGPSSTAIRHTPSRFIRVYSENNAAARYSPEMGRETSVVEVLRRGKSGSYQTTEGVFKLTAGELVLSHDPQEVWRLNTTDESWWLDCVRRNAWGCFKDVAIVRVGIKTTADELFVRTDWAALPDELRPEPELLRPLLRHENACRWAMCGPARPEARILYPHEVRDGRRRPVDLARYPRAQAYLESHRARLRQRHYVLEAGRQWYEIWVPQDPEGWSVPKIVFPDISPGPRFYLDDQGCLVDGDSYWITLRPCVPARTLWLILAVANSSLATRFHDLAFNNRLYSARRRYITQYVAQYPLPDPQSSVASRIISLAEQVWQETRQQTAWSEHPLSSELDGLVDSALGDVPMPTGPVRALPVMQKRRVLST